MVWHFSIFLDYKTAINVNYGTRQVLIKILLIYSNVVHYFAPSFPFNVHLYHPVLLSGQKMSDHTVWSQLWKSLEKAKCVEKPEGKFNQYIRSIPMQSFIVNGHNISWKCYTTLMNSQHYCTSTKNAGVKILHFHLRWTYLI